MSGAHVLHDALLQPATGGRSQPRQGAGVFVSKNPKQLRKTVVSVHADPGPPVTLTRVGDVGAISPAIEKYLADLADAVASEERERGRSRKVTVDILGRYRFDRDLVPVCKTPQVTVTFRTVHSAKGLEADFIVIPNMTSGLYGFPSNIVDDPVLNLAMAEPDPFPHAEERRLFYVALTCARREVRLVTVAGQESPFVVELIRDGLVQIEEADGADAVEVCPQCSNGTLSRRTGRYGEFWGCSTFPRCRYTRSL